MIQLSMIPRHIKDKARNLRPSVESHASDHYEVVCGKGHRHLVYFEFRDDDLYLECDPLVCPSRAACYHLAAAAEAVLRDHLFEGERVLVSERGGLVWHTVLNSDERYVYTREVPEGFRRTFIVDYELSSRRAAA
ncbi:MAG: hypothetical protein WCF57_20110 [Pyrinomonadaceae bacterium]